MPKANGNVIKVDFRFNQSDLDSAYNAVDPANPGRLEKLSFDKDEKDPVENNGANPKVVKKLASLGVDNAPKVPELPLPALKTSQYVYETTVEDGRVKRRLKKQDVQPAAPATPEIDPSNDEELKARLERLNSAFDAVQADFDKFELPSLDETLPKFKKETLADDAAVSALKPAVAGTLESLNKSSEATDKVLDVLEERKNRQVAELEALSFDNNTATSEEYKWVSDKAEELKAKHGVDDPTVKPAPANAEPKPDDDPNQVRIVGQMANGSTLVTVPFIPDTKDDKPVVKPRPATPAAKKPSNKEQWKADMKKWRSKERRKKGLKWVLGVSAVAAIAAVGAFFGLRGGDSTEAKAPATVEAFAADETFTPNEMERDADKPAIDAFIRELGSEARGTEAVNKAMDSAEAGGQLTRVFTGVIGADGHETWFPQVGDVTTYDSTKQAAVLPALAEQEGSNVKVATPDQVKAEQPTDNQE